MRPARTKRRTSGTTIVEYGGALVIFVCFVLVPLIDIGMIPIRHFLAAGTINELGYRLAHCKKRSDAYTVLSTEGRWRQTLTVFGITISDTKLKLIVCGHNPSDTATFNSGEMVPAEWLPGGAKGPCVYTLDLGVGIKMNPIYLSKVGLPGFNGPIAFNIGSRAPWENLGRDPNNLEYYLNE